MSSKVRTNWAELFSEVGPTWAELSWVEFLMQIFRGDLIKFCEIK